MIFLMSLLSVGLFVSLILLKVENEKAKIILPVIAAIAWFAFGWLGVMILCTIASIGILIADQMPTISKL